MKLKRTLCLSISIAMVTLAATANSLAQGVVDLSPYPTTGFVVGDANGDRVVNNADRGPFAQAVTDFDAWLKAFVPTANPRALDANYDRVFNNNDITSFMNIFLGVSPSFVLGDANGDGVVNSADINPLAQALVDYDAWYNTHLPPALPSALDTNRDGKFNNEDINAWVRIVTSPSTLISTPAVAVPEPTSCILLFSSVSFVTIGYRSKRDKRNPR